MVNGTVHMISWSLLYNTHESSTHSSFRSRCTRRCSLKAPLSRSRRSTMAIASAMKAMKASKALKATKPIHHPAAKVHFTTGGPKLQTTGRKLKWVTVSAPAYISGGDSPSLVSLTHMHYSLSHTVTRPFIYKSHLLSIDSYMYISGL